MPHRGCVTPGLNLHLCLKRYGRGIKTDDFASIIFQRPATYRFQHKESRGFRRPECCAQTSCLYVRCIKECDSPALSIRGTADRVHALALLSRTITITIADLVKEIKIASSKRMKVQTRGLRNFQWQKGYGAFGVSESKVSAVRAYIGNQEAHHQKSSFQDEFRALLKKHNFAFDEKFLWD